MDLTGGMPPAPERTFASDNSAGVHPAVLEALARANHGHALAYGHDDLTRSVERGFRELFEADVETFLVWGGTGANVMALATLVGPAQAVVASACSHLAVDETGAPERIVGAKVLELDTPDGRIRPEQLDELAPLFGVEHHAQPGVLSITQSSELGTVYAPDDVAALADAAHRRGMALHVDGARIANAAAALGGDLRAFTVEAGVDVISFGGTKNGMMYGEAVVYVDPVRAGAARYVRKQVTQLPSKMRYVAAQFDALLQDGRWLALADHANRASLDLYQKVKDVPEVRLAGPPSVNSLFPRLPRPLAERLRAWSPFYDWDARTGQVRWMTSWDTTAEDVDRFAEGVRAAAGST